MSLQEQEAVYSAQAETFLCWGRVFQNVDEVASYLSNVANSEWFFSSFGPTPAITVVEWKDRNRWAGAADIENSRLMFKPGVIHESVVLHELAHLLCGEDGHGQCFVNTQLKLVRQLMGFQCYAEYRHALARTGVFSIAP